MAGAAGPAPLRARRDAAALGARGDGRRRPTLFDVDRRRVGAGRCPTRSEAGSPPGTATRRCSLDEARALRTASTPTCRCRRRCRRPRWSGWPRDPDGLARDLARPMPRPPAPAARRGTRFHAWVEALFGARAAHRPHATWPGAADDGLGRRRPGRAAGRVPGRPVRRARRRTASRRRSSSCSADRVVRGRIDAVYRTDGRLRRRRLEDRPQRAPTRCSSRSTALAWARIAGVPRGPGGRGVLLRRAPARSSGPTACRARRAGPAAHPRLTRAPSAAAMSWWLM